MSEGEHLESRVAKLEGIVNQLADTVHDDIANSEKWRRSITSEIHELSEKSAPNLSVMAAWAGVVIAFVVAAASPIGFFLMRDSQRHDKTLESLDTKLQREATLISQRTDEQIKGLKEGTDGRFNERLVLIKALEDRVGRVQEFSSKQIQSDLDELRQRRMNGNKK